jgi:hypothetical protein
MGNFSDELSPIVDTAEAFGETDPTTTGLAAGAEAALCSLRTRSGLEFVLTGLGVLQDPAGDGYIEFALKINGATVHPFHRIRSAIASLTELLRCHVRVGQNDLVEIWAKNTHASTAFACAARFVGEYREFAHVA